MSKTAIPPALPEPRLRRAYRTDVAKRVQEEFGLKNVSQLPSIAKIVINVGVGKQLENQKLKPEYRDTVVHTWAKRSLTRKSSTLPQAIWQRLPVRSR